MTDIARTVARAAADIGGAPYRVDIRAGHHSLVADEPAALGGADAGASPFGLFLASLAACTAITLKMYAARKEWPLDGLHVDLRIARTGETLGIDRTVMLSGALDEAQRARLADIVERTPVTLAIKQGVPIATQFIDGAGTV